MIRDTFRNFSQDRVMMLAAALAYYTIFSLAPMLLIVISVAGLIWGREEVSTRIVEQFGGMIGEQGAQQIETMIQNAGQPGKSIWATIIGAATLIVGATGAFAQLKQALNIVWEVELRPGRGMWNTVRDRLLSFGLVLVIAFLLLATLVASAAVSAAGQWLGSRLPLPEGALHFLDAAISLAVITVLFALIFKYLPDVKIRWSDVWVGALATSVLFTIGKIALGLYLGRSAVGSVYGAAGSIVIILLWIYYASIILLLGAEFTQVYARRLGSRIEPSAIARFAQGREASPQEIEPAPTLARSAVPRVQVVHVREQRSTGQLLIRLALAGLAGFMEGYERRKLAQRERQNTRAPSGALRSG